MNNLNGAGLGQTALLHKNIYLSIHAHSFLNQIHIAPMIYLIFVHYGLFALLKNRIKLVSLMRIETPANLREFCQNVKELLWTEMRLYHRANMDQGPYSQHLIFFVSYESSQYGRVLHYITLERVASNKYSILLGQFVSHEGNKVL
jgi:hypothetical protein